MIITFTQKNKFGGYTHEIKLNGIYFIRITETTNKNFLIELVEQGLFSKKVHFAKPVEGAYNNILHETALILQDENLLYNLNFTPEQALEWMIKLCSFVESKKENLMKLSILEWAEN